MTPEASVQAAVIDLLLYQYHALVLRINSGAMVPKDKGGKLVEIHGEMIPTDNGERFVEFYRWQVLGLDRQRRGVSDVLALLPPPPGAVVLYPDAVGKWPERVTLWGMPLYCECKAPGKLANVTPAQRLFLDEVSSRGGLALAVDDVEILIRELEKRGY